VRFFASILDLCLSSAGFKKFWSFLDAIMKSDDQFIKSRMAKLCSQHGAELHSHIYNHQPLMSEQWISTQIRGILDLEGRRLAQLLTPEAGTPITKILSSFSLDTFLTDVKRTAPILFMSLSTLVGFDEGQNTRKQKDVVRDLADTPTLLLNLTR
jgi:hypothetical protein